MVCKLRDYSIAALEAFIISFSRLHFRIKFVIYIVSCGQCASILIVPRVINVRQSRPYKLALFCITRMTSRNMNELTQKLITFQVHTKSIGGYAVCIVYSLYYIQEKYANKERCGAIFLIVFHRLSHMPMAWLTR